MEAHQIPAGRGCALEAGEQELLGQEPVLGAQVLGAQVLGAQVLGARVVGLRVVELAAKTPGGLVRAEVEPVWVLESVESLRVGADTKTGTPAS